jgi:cytochrome P450
MATRLDQPTSAAADVPDHIPRELVHSLDFYQDPGMRTDPFATVAALHQGPRVFWNPVSPRYGHGSWVITQAEDIRHVLNSPQLFSSRGWSAHQALSGAKWPLIPLELDGDEHRKFRAMFNHWFAPMQVNKLADRVRARAVELIDAVAGQGGCEFMEAFGRPYPITIFMEVLGLPTQEGPTFSRWADDLLHTTDVDKRVRSAKIIVRYLEEVAASRKSKPTGDLISQIVASKVDGRLLTDDEIMGILFTLFLGSLDTVAASLGFHFRYLAEHPELQQRLRDDPSAIGSAVEEFLRRFSPVNARRRASEDTQIAGVEIKAGEWVTISYALGSLDGSAFARPMEVDVDRKNNRHLAFAYGPHFCVGAILARLELNTALQEWLRRMPSFRVRDGEQVEVHGGGVYGIDYLPLVWGSP